MGDMLHLEVDSFADKEDTDTSELLTPLPKQKQDKATPDKPKTPTSAPAAPTLGTSPAVRQVPNPLDSPPAKKNKAASPDPPPKPAKPKPAGKIGKGKVTEQLSRV